MASQFVRKITDTTVNEPISSLENGDIIITNKEAQILVNGKYQSLTSSYNDTTIKNDIKKLQDVPVGEMVDLSKNITFTQNENKTFELTIQNSRGIFYPELGFANISLWITTKSDTTINNVSEEKTFNNIGTLKITAPNSLSNIKGYGEAMPVTNNDQLLGSVSLNSNNLTINPNIGTYPTTVKANLSWHVNLVVYFNK